MNILDDLGDRLPTGERLYTMLAIVIIVVLVIGYLFFISASILPTLQVRTGVASQLSAAESPHHEHHPLHLPLRLWGHHGRRRTS